MNQDPHLLLGCKELAAALKKHVSYIYAMKQAGFPMPAEVASVKEARAWIRRKKFRKSKQ